MFAHSVSAALSLSLYFASSRSRSFDAAEFHSSSLMNIVTYSSIYFMCIHTNWLICFIMWLFFAFCWFIFLSLRSHFNFFHNIPYVLVHRWFSTPSIFFLAIIDLTVCFISSLSLSLSFYFVVFFSSFILSTPWQGLSMHLLLLLLFWFSLSTILSAWRTLIFMSDDSMR